MEKIKPIPLIDPFNKVRTHEGTYTVDLDNGDGNEVEIEVEYEIEPEEQQTRHTPYFAPQVNVYGATLNGQELCLLPHYELALTNQILEAFREGEIYHGPPKRY